MKSAIVLVLALLFVATAVPAQTTYNLPNSACSIQASDYLFCSQMGTITVGGTRYAVYTVWHIPGVYLYPVNATVLTGNDSDITFQNLTTGYEDSIFYSTATYVDRQLTANFSGDFTGSITFELVQTKQTPPCYRGCRTYYMADNVVLTLQ